MTSTITADVQTLEPGALVELFELDATAISGDLLRFHAYTQVGPIYWQGNEYSPWPIDAQGFEMQPSKPPIPTITVGNIDSSISAICLEYQDLVGAVVTRHRTLGKYLDAVNFPNTPLANITAASEPFTVATGATSAALTYDGHPIMSANVTAIHRTDWQGRQLLYPTARTNLCQYSELRYLVAPGSAPVTLTQNDTQDGRPCSSAQFTGATTPAGFSSARLTGAGGAANQSVFPIVIGQTYAITYWVLIDRALNGSETLSCYTTGVQGSDNSFSINASNCAPFVGKWGQISVSITATHAGPNYPAVFVSQALNAPLKISMTSCEVEQGATAGAFINNQTTGSATVTDYTPSSTSMALGRAAASGDVYDWDGTGQTYTPGGNPTADPTQELPPDKWYIERKAQETNTAVQFELSSALDFGSVMLPRRVIVANACAWQYRSAECGYTGAPVAKIDGTATTDPTLDACGKKLSDCKLRFGAGNPLPYGSFPAASLTS